jgi:hypothetical protein
VALEGKGGRGRSEISPANHVVEHLSLSASSDWPWAFLDKLGPHPWTPPSSLQLITCTTSALRCETWWPFG